MTWFTKMADKLDKKIKEQAQSDENDDIVFKVQSPIEELKYSTPEIEEEEVTETVSSAQSQDSTINSKANNLKLRVTRPRSFDDSSAIADLLLEGCTVFLNTDLMKPEETRRMLDFLNGITYTTYGYIKHVSPNSYIITPSDVDISEDCFWEQ